MIPTLKCQHCRQEIQGEPVRQGNKVYCCEACAFEATTRCGGFCGCRDSLEVAQRYFHRREEKPGS